MLQDQKAIVVGGSSGIGLACAAALSGAGAEVWITGRSAEKLTAAADGIAGKVTGRAVDGRDEAAMRAFFASVGSFDHLVLALGGDSAIGRFVDIDDTRFRTGFDAKFWAYMTAVRAGAPHLRAGGSLTFITGAASRRAIAGFSGLAAVNGAIDAMVGPLALEFAPTRVNAVSPGLIATPYWDRLPAARRDAMYAESVASVPVHRVGTAADIAGAVLFLVANSFTTGIVLECDGGRRLVG